MGVLICSQATQPNPTQNMKFLVALAFLLAVASIAESAPQNSDGVTAAKCLDSFDEFRFVNAYNCADNCLNCNLCAGSDLVVCQYCKEGEEKCTDLCKEGKEKCCALPEATGLCKDNFPEY